MLEKKEAKELVPVVNEQIKDEVAAASQYQGMAEKLRGKDDFAAGIYNAMATDEIRHRNLLSLSRDQWQAEAEDGLVVDEAKAVAGPCECFSLPSGKRYCWDQGIVGGLSQTQIVKYCPAEKQEERPGGIPQRIEHFIEASEKCEIGKEFDGKPIKDLRDRLRCMSKEAHSS